VKADVTTNAGANSVVNITGGARLFADTICSKGYVQVTDAAKSPTDCRGALTQSTDVVVAPPIVKSTDVIGGAVYPTVNSKIIPVIAGGTYAIFIPPCYL